jgi:two-component system sensor histidine kinase ChvG
MTAETERNWRESSRAATPVQMRRRIVKTRRSLKGVSAYGFSSLSRRIVVLNLCALLVLLSGFLFMNQFREGLIDARVQSLLTQG